jgi:predicted GNAT superfamily acetyltransferase
MSTKADGAELNSGSNVASNPGGAVIRALETAEDFRSCADLQRLTWGAEFTDLVPAHLMKISQRIGGVAAGAFDESEALLGFVFGMTGVRNGSLVHWSDMLAVRAEWRGLGIGQLLKQYQREQLLALGVPIIEWSFDPLVARNAHLNLVRLGARVSDYVVDMYGESTSDLHQGLGTDRLIVGWSIVSEPDVGSSQGLTAAQAARPEFSSPVADRGRESVSSSAPTFEGDPRQIRISVPLDIHEIRAASPEDARAWRKSTRASFLAALRDGYSVSTFETDRDARLGHYVLEQRESAGMRPGGAV